MGGPGQPRFRGAYAGDLSCRDEGVIDQGRRRSASPRPPRDAFPTAASDPGSDSAEDFSSRTEIPGDSRWPWDASERTAGPTFVVEASGSKADPCPEMSERSRSR